MENYGKARNREKDDGGGKKRVGGWNANVAVVYLAGRRNRIRQKGVR